MFGAATKAGASACAGVRAEPGDDSRSERERRSGRNRETATGVGLPCSSLAYLLGRCQFLPVAAFSFSLLLFFHAPYISSASPFFSLILLSPFSPRSTVHDHATPPMDPHQPIHHDDQSQNFVASSYAMYPPSEDDQSYLVYSQMAPYQGVVQHPGPPPRGFFSPSP